MRLFISTKKGFSVLEMIVVMLLVGSMAALAGVGYVQVVRGMLFTKMDAATIQKGELAITKLIKEFNNINISSIDPGTTNATSITFISVKDIGPSSHTVALSGDTVIFDGDILTDQVSDFSMKYYDNFDSTSETTYGTTWQSSRRIIEITLKLKGADDVISEFKARVKPRNS
jgi:prepilin-type N-terminal cleavage/methylation domain-containing protein